MNIELEKIDQLKDIGEACSLFGQVLGLGSPVSEEILLSAMEDEDFARNLLLARRDRNLLQHLLHHPPTRTNPSEISHPERPGNFQLAARAARSLAVWAISGFSTVADEVYEKRLAACDGCDQLEEAPDKLVYKISLKKGEDKRSCKACGCIVTRKARLTSDTCPLPDPENPAVNRWGDVR